MDVDGAVEKAKLEEFRATNVALMKKERDELKQSFEGIDPERSRPENRQRTPGSAAGAS